MLEIVIAIAIVVAIVALVIYLNRAHVKAEVATLRADVKTDVANLRADATGAVSNIAGHVTALQEVTHTVIKTLPSAASSAIGAQAAGSAALTPFDPSTQIATQWGVKSYKDFPTMADFAQLSVLTGRGLSDAEVASWMAVTGNADPRKATASGSAIDASKSAPVDETQLSLDAPGRHPLVILQPGQVSKDYPFTPKVGPCTVTTIADTATLGATGTSARVDVLLGNVIVASNEGSFQAHAAATFMAQGGVGYVARVTNTGTAPVAVHLQYN